MVRNRVDDLARSGWELFSAPGRLLLALVVCNLPNKVSARFGASLPVGLMRIPAAVLVLFAGGVLGFHGFLDFASDTASRNNRAMLEIAHLQASDPAPQGPAASAAMSVSLTMLSALAFALLTPTGLFCTYLFCSGFTRIVSSILDDSRGDPLIGLAHALGTRLLARRKEKLERRERERHEGPEVCDRVIDAGRVDLPWADLVVVASRRKPDWTPGTILAVGERFFRVGPSVERDLPVGLRTLYPLTEVRDAEAFRRVVRYEVPRTTP